MNYPLLLEVNATHPKHFKFSINFVYWTVMYIVHPGVVEHACRISGVQGLKPVKSLSPSWLRSSDQNVYNIHRSTNTPPSVNHVTLTAKWSTEHHKIFSTTKSLDIQCICVCDWYSVLQLCAIWGMTVILWELSMKDYVSIPSERQSLRIVYTRNGWWRTQPLYPAAWHKGSFRVSVCGQTHLITLDLPFLIPILNCDNNSCCPTYTHAADLIGLKNFPESRDINF